MTDLRNLPFAYIARFPGGVKGSPELDLLKGEPCLVSFSQSPNWIRTAAFGFSYFVTTLDTPSGPVFAFVMRQANCFLYVMADALDERLWLLFDEWERHGSYVSHFGIGDVARLLGCDAPELERFEYLRAQVGKRGREEFETAIDEVLQQNLLWAHATEHLRAQGKAHVVQKLVVEANILDFHIDGAALTINHSSGAVANDPNTTVH
jgi:hypothetical protein